MLVLENTYFALTWLVAFYYCYIYITKYISDYVFFISSALWSQEAEGRRDESLPLAARTPTAPLLALGAADTPERTELLQREEVRLTWHSHVHACTLDHIICSSVLSFPAAHIRMQAAATLQ